MKKTLKFWNHPLNNLWQQKKVLDFARIPFRNVSPNLNFTHLKVIILNIYSSTVMFVIWIANILSTHLDWQILIFQVGIILNPFQNIHIHGIVCCGDLFALSCKGVMKLLKDFGINWFVFAPCADDIIGLKTNIFQESLLLWMYLRY